MLTIKQVEQFTEIYFHHTASFKFKLCFLKDGKIRQLALVEKMAESIPWERFTNFINNQEDLTSDMLLTIEQASQGSYPLGSNVILKYGTLLEIDAQKDVQIIKDDLQEAMLKLS